MRTLTVGSGDEGQRLDKYLARVLKEADKSFLYRMLRKKNITLNDKKAEGNEKLVKGDRVSFFLSDETFEKFRGSGKAPVLKGDASLIKPVYEDSQILAAAKPAGMLTQKAEEGDLSLCEHLLAYLAAKGELGTEYAPGAANRLDRNTSGLVLAGKTLPGQQLLTYLLKNRLADKFYYCIVKKTKDVLPRGLSRLYWLKDEASNTASILKEPAEGASPVALEILPLCELAEGFAYLKIRLISGKSHQIRAQLAYLGFPVLGDAKYGLPEVNRSFARDHAYTLRHQLLHAGELCVPKTSEEQKNASGLSETALAEWRLLEGKKLEAPLPPNFRACLRILGGDAYVL